MQRRWGATACCRACSSTCRRSTSAPRCSVSALDPLRRCWTLPWDTALMRMPSISPASSLPRIPAGQRLAAPIIFAPMAQQRLCHPDGELAMARAAAAAGLPYTLSTMATSSIAEVAEAVAAPAPSEPGGPWNPNLWFQASALAWLVHLAGCASSASGATHSASPALPANCPPPRTHPADVCAEAARRERGHAARGGAPGLHRPRGDRGRPPPGCVAALERLQGRWPACVSQPAAAPASPKLLVPLLLHA